MGNKTALFQWIYYNLSPVIEKVNDDSFYYRKKKGGIVNLLSLPHWVILNPKPAPSIDGVDMRRCAKEGFLAPQILRIQKG